MTELPTRTVTSLATRELVEARVALRKVKADLLGTLGRITGALDILDDMLGSDTPVGTSGDTAAHE